MRSISKLKALEKNKSPGLGGTSIELFSSHRDQSIKILTKVCHQFWKQNGEPQTGNTQYLFPSQREDLSKTALSMELSY